MEDIKAIRLFVEIAERKSFSGAAKALGMTPASATRILSQLEERLGQQLLLRTTRQVSMTSAGATLLARYRPLLDQFDQVFRDTMRELNPYRGQLRINTPLSFGLRFMHGLSDQFRLAYPNVELFIQMTDDLVDIVEENCDLAIRVSHPPTDKSTIWRQFCKIPRLLVASPNYLERHGKPQTPAALNSLNCLSYATKQQSESWLLTLGGVKETIAAGTQLVSNNGDFLAQMSVAGAGIALLPEFIVAREIAEKRLCQVLPQWQASSLILSLYYPPYAQLPPLVATFTDFFEAYIADLEAFETDDHT